MVYSLKNSLNILRQNWPIFVFFAIFILLFSSSLYFRNLIGAFINYLAGLIEQRELLGALIFLAVSTVSVIISPFSSIPLIPSAIIVWGKLLTLALLFVGWLTGAIFGYLIGCFLGEKVLRKYYSFEKIDYFKKQLSPRSQFWMVLLFRLAIPSEITGYTLGIIKYDFWKYLLATAISEIPFAVISIYSGDALLQGNLFYFSVILIIGGFFVVLTSYLFDKIRQEQKKR